MKTHFWLVRTELFELTANRLFTRKTNGTLAIFGPQPAHLRRGAAQPVWNAELVPVGGCRMVAAPSTEQERPRFMMMRAEEREKLQKKGRKQWGRQ